MIYSITDFRWSGAVRLYSFSKDNKSEETFNEAVRLRNVDYNSQQQRL